MTITVTPLDATKLVRQETYTDNAAGDIIHEIPVLLSGERDPIRKDRFFGSCTMRNDLGSAQIRFMIEAENLTEAFMGFEFACKKAIEQVEAQQQQQRILNPGRLAPPKAKR